MADALCGPSNPLQSLRKHTQLDRTLQQDRLVQSRQSAAAAEQFRSHDPRTAGALDVALDAFEHAQPHPLDFPSHHDTSGWQRQPLHHHHPAPAVAAGGGGWAADFQKLYISQTMQTTPSPVPVSQFRTEAPLITSTHAGWDNDFLQQQSGGGVSLKGKEAAANGGFSYDYRHQETAFAQQQPLNGLAMQRGFMDHQQQHVVPPTLMQEQQDQVHGSQQQQWENVSSEAFEAAFRDAVVSEAQAFEQTVDDFELQQQPEVKIGSDAIPYTEVKDRTADQDTRDADDLARTAGQLVEMLKDEGETNRKFRESEFLGLMRRLRDREVEVRDNEMVETSNLTSTTTITGSSSSSTAALGGGNVEQHQEPKPSQATEEENNVAAAPAATTEQYDWAFPNMDDIYAPTNNDLDTASRSYSPFWESSQQEQQQQQQQPQASGLGQYISMDELYHSGSDEFPDHQLQEQALHPGGKWYPEQHQQEKKGPEAVMSGAVTPDTAATNGGGEAAIKLSDFDNGDVEESGFFRRFSASRSRSLSMSAAVRGLA